MVSSIRYLLDTNVISELSRRKPQEKVVGFFAGADTSSLCMSVLTIGELRKGAARKAQTDTHAARRFEAWIDGLEATYSARILPVDLPVANLWAKLAAQRSRPIIDTLLAATALHYGLILVTRNTSDVADTGVQTINPWDAP